MVSNARDDLPEPDRPVMTTSLSRGMSTSTFLRLCTRAPRTAIHLRGIRTDYYILFAISTRRHGGTKFQFFKRQIRARYRPLRVATSALWMDVSSSDFASVIS